MLRPLPLRAALSLLAAAVFVGLVPQAFAERADKDKPVVINADQGGGDNINQTSLYTGDVVLTKGTILLRTDQLTIKEDPEGYNFGTAVMKSPGRLAYFKQKREGVDEFIEGQAERIEYDEKSDTVHLINRAIVKRLAAGRDADEMRGDKIDYNSRTEIYAAQSNGTGKRSTFILQPKIRPGSSGTADSPGARSPTPPIELKKQPTIEAKPES